MKAENVVTVIAGAGAAYLVFHMSRPVAHALAPMLPKAKAKAPSHATAKPVTHTKAHPGTHAMTGPVIPEHAVVLSDHEAAAAHQTSHMPAHHASHPSVITPTSVPTQHDEQASSIPEPSPIVHRTPKQAAKSLYDYVKSRISAGQGHELHQKYNEIVDKAQRDMGGAKLLAAVDKGQAGIYGPLTRARGKELLGMPFPEV